MVLKDFEALRKRYGTVFRESGAGLLGRVLKRFVFEEASDGEEDEDEDEDEDDEDDENNQEDQGDGNSYCLAFEEHVSLVTPRGPLDGSLGCNPPRTQALVVLYRAQGGELTGMWIAPDTDGLGADAAAAEAVVRKADVFARFSKLLRRLSGGRRLTSRWEVMQSQNNSR